MPTPRAARAARLVPAGTRPKPHIVAGVDGPATDWSALAWARDEALATGGRLTICRAGPPPAGGSTMDALVLDDPSLARAVHDIRLRVGGDRVGLRFAAGDPVDVLATAAADADLVVVGPPEPDRWWSPAVRAADVLPVPVVVVRSVRHGTGLFAGHVVAAVSGGPGDARHDRAVADLALRYAQAHRLPVAALHVGSTSTGDYWFDEDTLETHFAVEPPAIGLLAAVLEPARADRPGVPVRLCVQSGPPLRRLVTAADHALLTVVGRGRRLTPALIRRTTGTVVVVPNPSRPAWLTPASGRPARPGRRRRSACADQRRRRRTR